MKGDVQKRGNTPKSWGLELLMSLHLLPLCLRVGKDLLLYKRSIIQPNWRGFFGRSPAKLGW